MSRRVCGRRVGGLVEGSLGGLAVVVLLLLGERVGLHLSLHLPGRRVVGTSCRVLALLRRVALVGADEAKIDRRRREGLVAWLRLRRRGGGDDRGRRGGRLSRGALRDRSK